MLNTLTLYVDNYKHIKTKHMSLARQTVTHIKNIRKKFINYLAVLIRFAPAMVLVINVKVSKMSL